MARWILVLVSLALACGEASEPGSEQVSTPAPAEEAGFAGMYEVAGVTTDQQTGDTRRITGTVIIAGGGEEAYSTTFSMTTELVTRDGPLKADLIGTGEGRAEGARLVGTAETQMFLAAIPGLDPKFPFIPGRLGPRVVSDFVMDPADAGAYRIEIETRAAPGDAGKAYGSTRTNLRAVRTTTPLGQSASR